MVALDLQIRLLIEWVNIFQLYLYHSIENLFLHIEIDSM